MHPAILLLIILLLIVLACLIANRFFGMKFGGMFNPEKDNTYGILNPMFKMSNACAQALDSIRLAPIKYSYVQNYQDYVRTNFDDIYNKNLEKIIADHTISITNSSNYGNVGFYSLLILHSKYNKTLFLNYCKAVKFIIDNALFKDISPSLTFKLSDNLNSELIVIDKSNPQIEILDRLFPGNLIVSMDIDKCHMIIDKIMNTVENTEVKNSSLNIVEDAPLRV